MSEDDGVYYHADDHAGVGRRLLIDLVDASLVISASLLVWWALYFFWPHEQSLGVAVVSAWTVVWFCYFVLLKRSRYRTAGYRLFGVRIVNLQGERPSIFSLVIRLLFAIAGPANFILDLLWIPSDDSRQAIRDKFAHTYVIRTTARPVGSGKIVYRTYSMLGTTFYFREVRKLPASAA